MTGNQIIMQRLFSIWIFIQISLMTSGQIIADHTIVDKYDQIPQQYIDAVKKMWATNPGESHSAALRQGLLDLEAFDPKFSVSIVTSGIPEPYTTTNLRFSGATRGDYTYTDRWQYDYGEEDWFTNPTALSRTKAGITYCNTHSLELAAIGFCWCYDDSHTSNISATFDPVYGCRWYGRSYNGPEGNRCWGLDAEDKAITGNSVCLDTYLSSTQEYVDYCAAQGYKTKVYFTTGPVEPTYYKNEAGYQASLKHQRIRDYVKADPSLILFDYADILCYDDGSEIMSTSTWSGHTFPVITSKNYGDGDLGHIDSPGALRLAKAMWWMLARIAGWDGGIGTDIGEVDNDGLSEIIVEKDDNKIIIKIKDNNPFNSIALSNFNGSLISNQPIRNNMLFFDTSNLSSGLYFIIMSNGKRRQVKKIAIP